MKTRSTDFVKHLLRAWLLLAFFISTSHAQVVTLKAVMVGAYDTHLQACKTNFLPQPIFTTIVPNTPVRVIRYRITYRVYDSLNLATQGVFNDSLSNIFTAAVPNNLNATNVSSRALDVSPHQPYRPYQLDVAITLYLEDGSRVSDRVLIRIEPQGYTLLSAQPAQSRDETVVETCYVDEAGRVIGKPDGGFYIEVRRFASGRVTRRKVFQQASR